MIVTTTVVNCLAMEITEDSEGALSSEEKIH